MKKTYPASAFVLLLLMWLITPYEIQAENGTSLSSSTKDYSVSPDYVLHGSSWDCRYITYNFTIPTDDLSLTEAQAAVRRAMATWSEVTNIDFIETCSPFADIRISWLTGNHGPTLYSGFGNPGQSFAITYPPPPPFHNFSGDIGFNDFYDWTIDGDAFSVEIIALTELGKALGLRAYIAPENCGIVMDTYYGCKCKVLAQDDINGIQAIYGARENPIQGQDKMCENGTFELLDFDCLEDGMTVTWSTSSNLSIETGQGTGEVSILPLTQSGLAYITAIIDSGCDQVEFTKEVSLIDCQECCPAGATFDGYQCSFGEGVPQGYEGFIWENRFYVKPDCKIDPDNHCCPLGYTFDGYNCFSGIRYIDWYEGFIEDDKYYTKPNCRLNCCPSGFNYDGANCHSGVNYTDVNAFIYENNFYTSPNCEVYPGTCCPPGSGFDGFNCHFGPVPFGYKGFIYNNGFYVTPNCEICCPEGATYDGANCHYGIDIPEGHEGFVFNNNFYVKPNCKLNPGSCCPPGTSFDGVNCHYNNINIPDSYEAFIWNNSLYTKAIDCYEGGDKSNGKSRSGDLEEGPLHLTEKVEVYPNPTSGAFTVNLGSMLKHLQEVDLIGVNGQVILTFPKSELEATLRIEEELDSGVYFLRLRTHLGVQSIKVVKI